MATSGTSQLFQLGTRSWRIFYTWTATYDVKNNRSTIALDLYARTDYAGGWHTGHKAVLTINGITQEKTVPGVPNGQGATDVFQATFTQVLSHNNSTGALRVTISGNYYTATSTSYAAPSSHYFDVDPIYPNFVRIRAASTAGGSSRGRVYIRAASSAGAPTLAKKVYVGNSNGTPVPAKFA